MARKIFIGSGARTRDLELHSMHLEAVTILSWLEFKSSLFRGFPSKQQRLTAQITALRYPCPLISDTFVTAAIIDKEADKSNFLFSSINAATDSIIKNAKIIELTISITVTKMQLGFVA